MLPTVAAGTLRDQHGRDARGRVIGPPTCGIGGVPGVCMGQTCMSLDAGGGWHGPIVRLLQTMVATVPPSADHAAPATCSRALEQRKTIDRGDLLRLGEAPERDLRGLRRRAPRRARCPAPRRPGRRARPRRATAATPPAPGATALTSTPSRRPAVGEHARERQLRRLRHRVGGVRQRRALAGRRADVDDPPAAALPPSAARPRA